MEIMDGDGPVKVLHVVQGAIGVSDDPAVIYTALIGSSVLVCLYDPAAKLGGMAHFLFPGSGADARFGAVAIRSLTQNVEALGGQILRLQAKIFGGAKLHEGHRDMGLLNTEFAAQILAGLGVAVVAQDIGADVVRRVRFHPSSGDSTVAMQDHGMPDAHFAGFTGNV